MAIHNRTEGAIRYNGIVYHENEVVASADEAYMLSTHPLTFSDLGTPVTPGADIITDVTSSFAYWEAGSQSTATPTTTTIAVDVTKGGVLGELSIATIGNGANVRPGGVYNLTFDVTGSVGDVALNAIYLGQSGVVAQGINVTGDGSYSFPAIIAKEGPFLASPFELGFGVDATNVQACTISAIVLTEVI